MFTTKHAQVLYRVASPQTIRNWANEFAGYLSPTATPGTGNTRRFSLEDMEVLALIAELSSQGVSFDDIHAALASGQRGKVPTIAPEELDVLVAGEVERQLNVQLHEATQLSEQLQAEINALKESVQPLREENIRLQAQVEDRNNRISELSKQLQEAQERITRLAEEKGEAYYKGLYESAERNRKDAE